MLPESMKSYEIFSLEHSQYSEDKGMFPFHTTFLFDAIEANNQDFYYNNREENKWQIIFIGSMKECNKYMNQIVKKRKTNNPSYLKDWDFED
jgi:hypothetical protein